MRELYKTISVRSQKTRTRTYKGQMFATMLPNFSSTVKKLFYCGVGSITWVVSVFEVIFVGIRVMFECIWCNKLLLRCLRIEYCQIYLVGYKSFIGSKHINSYSENYNCIKNYPPIEWILTLLVFKSLFSTIYGKNIRQNKGEPIK